VAGVLLPFLISGDCWTNYGKAMGEWSDVYRNDRNPTAGALAYPAKIEGLKLDHIARYGVNSMRTPPSSVSSAPGDGLPDRLRSR